MIISPFTIFQNQEANYTIYNSLTNSLLNVNHDMYQLLLTAKNGNFNIELDRDIFDKDDWDLLKNKRIIVNSKEDELLLYKSLIIPLRNQTENMSMTIATTLDCNYKCFYCFEEKKKVYITDEVIQNIISLINNNKFQNIRITWFGGEPLMAYDKIVLFNSLLKLPKSVSYGAGIITNGYYLTKEVIENLNNLRITTIQITLDGMKETHNKRKFCSETKDTFSVVINNIDIFSKIHKEIKLKIRVNLDEKNKHEYIKLEKYLKERYKNCQNISIVPAFLLDISPNERKSSCNFDRNGKAKFYKYLSQETNNAQYLYPSNSFGECAIRNKNAIAIAPDGGVYKCWEIIGDEKYKYGELTDKGIKITDKTILNRYLYGADPLDDAECTSCAYLPICFGGCPHKRIENIMNGKYNDVCIHHKDNLNEYLSQFTSIKDSQ